MLNERLKIARNNAKYTQDDVAEYLSVIRQTYSAYETGRSTPDAKTLNALAEFYNVDVNYLLGNTNNPTPPGKQKVHYPHMIDTSDFSEESKKELESYIKLLKLRDRVKKMNTDMEANTEIAPGLQG